MKNKISLWKVADQYSIHELLDHLEQNSYVKHQHGDDWAMLIKTKQPVDVSWKDFVSAFLDAGLDQPQSSNSSFVYILTVDGLLYCLTGGYGHTAIPKFIDQEFGLNVAIRMISDVNDISALNQAAFKGPIRQQFRTVENYNILSDRENFDKLLRQLQAKALFRERSLSISARANLAFQVDESIEQVPDIIREVERVLNSPVKIEIPKAYSVVKEQAICDQLESHLIGDFSSYWNGQGNRDRFYAEFDNPLMQFSSEKFIFKIGTGNRLRQIELTDFDLDLIDDEMKDSLGLRNTEITRKILDRIFVFGVTNDERHQGGATLYEMLVYDIVLANTDYVKMGKKWYKIDQNFVDNLDRSLDSVPVRKEELPVWHLSDYKTENAYNNYVTSLKSGNCLDADCVQIGQQKIELCDVFVPQENTLYHIKKTWGAKSSYLFLQGSTAIDYYENNEDFRNACSEKWPSLFQTKIPVGKLMFGIGMSAEQIEHFPKNLTFFAKLNLVEACNKIQNLKWEVLLCPILVEKA